MTGVLSDDVAVAGGAEPTSPSRRRVDRGGAAIQDERAVAHLDDGAEASRVEAEAPQ